MPDFTRFSRSQRDQTIGQTVALPATMVVFAAMGVIITSASAIIFGRTIWDPVQLVAQFTQPVVVAISMFTVVVATLSVNIAANVVSPANDFANAFPRVITFRLGGLITGILGIIMQPWRLLADPSGYVFQWLGGYSGGLGINRGCADRGLLAVTSQAAGAALICTRHAVCTRMPEAGTGGRSSRRCLVARWRGEARHLGMAR